MMSSSGSSGGDLLLRWWGVLVALAGAGWWVLQRGFLYPRAELVRLSGEVATLAEKVERLEGKMDHLTEWIVERRS